MSEKVRFEGIDDFNRPVFKSLDNRNRYGSTDELFSHDAKEKHATHTPGPWHAFEQNASNPNSKGLFEIDANHPSGNRQTVAVTPFAGDGHELWANARLIAAAPEMYEKLCELCNVIIALEEKGVNLPYHYFKDDMSMSDKLREVLAKVDGGEG